MSIDCIKQNIFANNMYVYYARIWNKSAETYSKSDVVAIILELQ